jgi:dTDP-4-amino-4,6-dideoxygalactose transaminase
LVIPIHLFGSVCAMDELMDVCKTYALPVMEDAAQAVGAEYPSRQGPLQAGSISESAYFSFFPTKNLGGAGDGGMAVCKEAAFAEKLRHVRNHGMSRTYHHETVGGNFRLDALQAAVLHAKLPFLAGWNEARQRNADLYREGFKASLPEGCVTLPTEPYRNSGLTGHHTYHQYVIRAKDRDALKEHLSALGIGHAVYYPLPLHLQPCFASLGHTPGDFPEAERASQESLALPIFPELTEEEISAVVGAVASFYRR